jgi:hypothetical protein
MTAVNNDEYKRSVPTYSRQMGCRMEVTGLVASKLVLRRDSYALYALLGCTNTAAVERGAIDGHILFVFIFLPLTHCTTTEEG